MELPPWFPSIHPQVVQSSLRDSLAQWWFTNQLLVLWSLLLIPLVLELAYGTFPLLYLVLIAFSILVTYLIYRRYEAEEKERTGRP